MLPKKYRLTVSQFNQIPQKSTEIGRILFTVKVKYKTSDNPKFTFIIPKSLDKRSSARHQTKRIAEELIREKIKDTLSPVSILIKFKKIIAKNDKLKLKEELDDVLSKI